MQLFTHALYTAEGSVGHKPTQALRLPPGQSPDGAGAGGAGVGGAGVGTGGVGTGGAGVGVPPAHFAMQLFTHALYTAEGSVGHKPTQALRLPPGQSPDGAGAGGAGVGGVGVGAGGAGGAGVGVGGPGAGAGPI